MTHTEAQIQEAVSLVRMPDAKSAKAWEAQLRADNPSAWFIVAGRKLKPHTPESAAAAQVLYFCADSATAEGRAILFRALARLTGQPIAAVTRTWERTRHA